MNFDWTPEQQRLRDDARHFGAEVLRAEKGVEAAGFDRARWRRLGDWGYLGLCVPESYGGSGLDPFSALAVTEGLAYGCRDTGLLFSATVQAYVVIRAFLCFGTEEQKRRWLPGLADGTLIGAFAVTEPDAGSDALAMSTCASRADDGWILNGRKAWLTNGPVADVIVCFARVESARMPGTISAFVVDAHAPGVVRERPSQLMGLRTSSLGEVAFDDVRLPSEAVLGRQGRGTSVFSEMMEHERIWLMAMQVGISEREFDEARRYAHQRHAFGTPIARHQAVANRLVEMKMRLDVGRLLVQRAAWVKTQGRRAALESAMSKLWVSEACIANGLDSMRLHGAYGYSAESGVERGVRDSLAGLYYSGTADMLRGVVAREIEL